MQNSDSEEKCFPSFRNILYLIMALKDKGFGGGVTEIGEIIGIRVSFVRKLKNQSI